MKTVNVSEFRKNIKENLDLVSNESETLIIYRPHGTSVVIISLEEYNKMIDKIKTNK